MTKKKELDVVFLLDRSGSMQGSETDTIGGYNSYLEQQRKNKFNTKITTVLFDENDFRISCRRSAVFSGSSVSRYHASGDLGRY